MKRLASLTARCVFVLALVLTSKGDGATAQGTAGKVQGTVLDPTGQPLANAQVFILGTSFAAHTDRDGFYFINNIPAAIYAMRAQFLGYQAAQVENVRVLADQTRTIDFRLGGAIALEAVTISAATDPLVPRDQVTSKSVVRGEDLERLPVVDAMAVVSLQPGVIIGRGGNLHIRGSRANEAAVFIDGVPVRTLDTGNTPMSVSTNTLQELSVTTGAMEASFGDAQAGVISLVTRTGGSRWVGTLTYEGDDMLGKKLSMGYNAFEASLSGPVIGNLTFAAGGTLRGWADYSINKGIEAIPTYTYAGVDTTVIAPPNAGDSDSAATLIPRIIQFGGTCDPNDNYGFECQGRLRSDGWDTHLRANAKLQYTYGSGSRISLSGLTDVSQGLSPTTMNVEGAGGNRSVSRMLVFNWVQQVFRRTGSELSFDLNLSYQQDRSLNGAVERDQELELRSPRWGIVLSPLEFITDFERWGPGDPTGILSHGDTLADGGFFLERLKTDEDWDMFIENVRYDQGSLRSYLNRDEINTRRGPRMNAHGVSGGPTNYGVNLGQGFRSERRYVGRLNVDWQADRYNRIKLGAEGTVGSVGRWEMGWTAKSFGQGYSADPYKWAAYAQDRLDLGDVVIELGVRYDKFNTRAIFPLVPGRIFTNPAFDQTKTVDEMTCPYSRTECAENYTHDYVWYSGVSHSSWAPRLRVAFPVTDRTGFRLSYAHQTQSPNFNDMYRGTNNDLANTNTNDRFGGDVEYGKTILFEFGIRHAFSQDMVLDISAYNKEKVSDITYRVLPFFDPFTDRINNVNIITNADFGNVRGVDVQLQRRFGNIFSGQVTYTYQNAKSTGSDPTDFLGGLSRAPYSVTGERPEAPQTTMRTRDDRRHNLQGSFSATFPHDFGRGVLGAMLRDAGLFGWFAVTSGLPYTRLVNAGQGNVSSGGFGLLSNLVEPLQASETPWEKYFYLKATKGFRLGPVDLTAYAELWNVFNFTNKPTVFSETGDVRNDFYLQREYLNPELLTIEQDARASGAWTTVLKDAGTPDERRIGAVDLTSIAATCPQWVGGGGAVACVMLERTERRFGNGDGIYDVEEQVLAVTDYYNLTNSPASLYDAGRVVRLGVSLIF